MFFKDKVAVITRGAQGIGRCIAEEFQYAMNVGVTAPFYLTKLFAPYFTKNAAIVNISSSRDRMSQPQMSYTAAKGGIAAFTHALLSALQGRYVSTLSPQDGLIRTVLYMKAPMPYNSQPDVSAILWISRTWRSTSAPTKPVSSQARTSASTVA